MYMCVYVCMYVLYVCICVYMYVYVCTRAEPLCLDKEIRLRTGYPDASDVSIHS